MSAFARSLAELRAARDIAGLVATVPYFRFLGLTAIEVDGELRTVLPADPKLIGNPLVPALHGGVIGGFLEATAILQLLLATDTDRVPRTIDIGIDFLRSARPVETFARATIARHGRRVANVQAFAWQDDPARPVTVMHGHFLLAERESRASTSSA